VYIPKLLTLIALLGFSAPAMAEPAEHMQAYVNQTKYGYCDATLIAGLWGEDVYQAKGTIGYKLANGYEQMLVSALTEARKKANENFSNRGLRCSYDVLGYSYEDAVKLAEHWGKDTWDAKMYIEKKFLLDGNKTHIDEALRTARAAGSGSAPADPMQAYFASKYDYCDAAALGALWGQSVSEAKASIGNKIVHGMSSSLSTLIPQARAHAKQAGNVEHCTY